MLTVGSCPADYPDRLRGPPRSDATDVHLQRRHGQNTAMTTPAPAGQSGHETTTYTYDDAGNLARDGGPADEQFRGRLRTR